MAAIESAYETALRAVRPLLEALPLGGKLGRGVRGRRGAVDRLTAWAAAARDPDVPLLWLHAPSVGEALMAQAIIRSLRAERAELQVAFTFFSPSAERVADRVGADIADYLPWDVSTAARALLDALRPAAIAFVRTELWPVLTREATNAGVPMAMINAVLPAGSTRLGGAARRFLGPSYARLDAVGAVSEADARRFEQLGVAPARTHVTGDARFDQVRDRLRAVRPGAELAARVAMAGPALVAGSTWPADEERLVPAFAAARQRRRLRLIIAPHEPTAEHLATLERRLHTAGVRHLRLSVWEGEPGVDVPDALVVDRVGILADLYAAGEFAYVGGGFGGDGLHSVIEPAALGLPVIVGPEFGAAAEAERLVAAGGAFRVDDVTGLSERLFALAASAAERARAGDAARLFVDANLGAADRNAALVLELIGGAAPRPETARG